VSDRLQSIFKNDRADFEKKWDDLKIFIHYGMLTQEDFYDKANKFSLLKDTDDKFYTYEEYQTLIKENQTDKEGNVIYLYANNKEEQYSYIEAAKSKGYSVLLMYGQLDVALISMLERKFEKSRFTRVDSDVIDRLIMKEDVKTNNLAANQQSLLSTLFRTSLPKVNKVEFQVESQALGENTNPIVITQSEYMRRMKEMANIQAGMSFYGEMPDMFNVIVNTDHRLVKEVLSNSEAACNAALSPVQEELKQLKQREEALNKQKEGKKAEEIPTADKDELEKVEKEITAQQAKEEGIISDYAGKDKLVKQLIDLALLQNNMLKGEALNNFIKRSLEMF
jgi:molecular chaperone HtpG